MVRGDRWLAWRVAERHVLRVDLTAGTWPRGRRWHGGAPIADDAARLSGPKRTDCSSSSRGILGFSPFPPRLFDTRSPPHAAVEDVSDARSSFAALVKRRTQIPDDVEQPRARS